eukprot:gene36-9640_t
MHTLKYVEPDFNCQNEDRFSGLALLLLEVQIVFMASSCLCYVMIIYIAYELIIETVKVKRSPAKKKGGTEDSILHNKGLRECYSAPDLCTMKLEENSKLETSFTTSPLLIAWPIISSKGDCEGEGKEGSTNKGEDTTSSTPEQRVELCSNGHTRLAANGAGDGGDDDDDENKDRKNRKKPLPPSDFKLEEKEPKNDESSSQERMEVDEFQGSQDDHMEYSDGEKSDWSMRSLEQNGDVPLNLQPQVPIMWQNQELHIIKLLGEGSFGTCVQVEDKANGRVHALKQIKKEVFDIEEVKVLQILQSSQHVIRYFALISDINMFYLLFEFAQGGTLKEFLGAFKKNSSLHCSREIVKFFYDIMHGVAYCHRKNIIHADIKSENILMVSRNGGGYQPVLADFGLAINATSSEYNRGVLKPRGTIRYRSPEMIKNGTVNSFTSDVWSCGCVLVDMDTGDPPWKQAESMGEVAFIYMIGTAKSPPIPENGSPNLLSLYEATLNLDPFQRLTALQILDKITTFELH